MEREREMIRRKVHSSTVYRKPSFTKASTTFNIYNTNSEAGKMSMITRNQKLNELKEEIKRVSSGFDDESHDDEDKSMLCIGNKYLNSNLLTAPSITSKSASTTNLELINGDIANPNSKSVEAADFEKAISQSHLSPSASFTNFGTYSSKKLHPGEKMNSHENLTNLLKSARIDSATSVTSQNIHTNINGSNETNKSDNKTLQSDAGDEIQDIQSPFDNLKRKDHSKINKKSTQKILYAVGVNVNGTNGTNDDEDIIVDGTTTDNHCSLHHLTASTKKSTKKHGGVAISRKKSSSHNSRKSGVKNSPKKNPTAIRKSQELS